MFYDFFKSWLLNNVTYFFNNNDKKREYQTSDDFLNLITYCSQDIGNPLNYCEHNDKYHSCISYFTINRLAYVIHNYFLSCNKLHLNQNAFKESEQLPLTFGKLSQKNKFFEYWCKYTIFKSIQPNVRTPRNESKYISLYFTYKNERKLNNFFDLEFLQTCFDQTGSILHNVINALMNFHCKLLLEQGFSKCLSIKNHSNETPYDIAKKPGKPQIIAMLPSPQVTENMSEQKENKKEKEKETKETENENNYSGNSVEIESTYFRFTNQLCCAKFYL